MVHKKLGRSHAWKKSKQKERCLLTFLSADNSGKSVETVKIVSSTITDSRAHSAFSPPPRPSPLPQLLSYKFFICTTGKLDEQSDHGLDGLIICDSYKTLTDSVVYLKHIKTVRKLNLAGLNTNMIF